MHTSPSPVCMTGTKCVVTIKRMEVLENCYVCSTISTVIMFFGPVIFLDIILISSGTNF